MANAKRMGGNVSLKKKKKQDNDTAPLLEDCQLLQVNEKTRWKAGVFTKQDGNSGDDEEINSDKFLVLKKSLLILNQLFLKQFEKLPDAFIDTGIGKNDNCLAGAIELIVMKAQDELHFAAMYVALALSKTFTNANGLCRTWKE